MQCNLYIGLRKVLEYLKSSLIQYTFLSEWVSDYRGFNNRGIGQPTNAVRLSLQELLQQVIRVSDCVLWIDRPRAQEKQTPRKMAGKTVKHLSNSPAHYFWHFEFCANMVPICKSHMQSHNHLSIQLMHWQITYARYVIVLYLKCLSNIVCMCLYYVCEEVFLEATLVGASLWAAFVFTNKHWLELCDTTSSVHIMIL